MATPTKPRHFVIFLIVLTLLVVSSEARLGPQFSTMDKKINSKVGLRELINNVRNGKWHGKRSMPGERVERVSPAGPDPDHH